MGEKFQGGHTFPINKDSCSFKYMLTEIDSAKSILIHVGINNLKKQSAQETFQNYLDMMKTACEKSSDIIISLPTPAKSRYLNEKVQEFNRYTEDRFRNAQNITVCRNGNFMRNGVVVSELFFNETKLSRDHGIPLLAGNLRRSLFPSLKQRDSRRPTPFSVQPPGGRPTPFSVQYPGGRPFDNPRWQGPNQYRKDRYSNLDHSMMQDKFATSIATAIRDVLFA